MTQVGFQTDVVSKAPDFSKLTCDWLRASPSQHQFENPSKQSTRASCPVS